MSGLRKNFTPKMKAKIALEAVKGEKTLAELSSLYEVHTNQISKWKKELLETVETLFQDKRKQENKSQEAKESLLYQQIGQLKVELDWLKKKSELLK